MKTKELYYSLFILCSAALIVGCASTGMDRSEKASASINDLDKDIRKLNKQVDVMSESLNALLLSGSGDTIKAFEKYSDNLEDFEDNSDHLLARIDNMKSKSKEYFSEWEKQGDDYTNPQIRELSEQRRRRLANIYAQVPEALVGIKGSLLAYLTNQKEIKAYLSNDLTPKGLESITPVVRKSEENLDVLKESLKPLLVALDDIQAELYDGSK